MNRQIIIFGQKSELFIYIIYIEFTENKQTMHQAFFISILKTGWFYFGHQIVQIRL